MNNEIEVVDAEADEAYQRFLYRCLAAPYRKYRTRREYLEAAVPKGFRKKILFFNGEPVAQIEYAHSEGSGYPIMGKSVIVMHCIWVLRRAKGHMFGKLLLREMMGGEPEASGFSTIGLENHWSPWLRRDHLEYLGFKSIDSIRVAHKTKHMYEPFTMHLMWLPSRANAIPPTWNKKKLLEGVAFCLAHPLYHPQSYKPKEILRKL